MWLSSVTLNSAITPSFHNIIVKVWMWGVPQQLKDEKMQEV